MNEMIFLIVMMVIFLACCIGDIINFIKFKKILKEWRKVFEDSERITIRPKQ